MQRKGSGFRSTSTVAPQVITGVISIDLMIEERRYLDELGNRHMEEFRSRERTLTCSKNDGKLTWKKVNELKHFPNIRNWIICKNRNIDYYKTQFLSEHGYFKIYSKRIWKIESGLCKYCGEFDTSRYAILCSRCNIELHNAEIRLGFSVLSEK